MTVALAHLPRLDATGARLEVARAPEPMTLGWLPIAVGFVVAAGTGVLALLLVLRLLYRARFRYFSYYVWALAAVVAWTAVTGAL